MRIKTKSCLSVFNLISTRKTSCIPDIEADIKDTREAKEKGENMRTENETAD